ncbi:hypothetical protein DOTSEDRAFT_82193 [Dothistroma septosporum NZE10]|uniref:Uncharacterized protein n=1 Tax=Dothistroma septosporum (strain NZE10 / CBS 128990) TaxID=675120 RepID=N1PGY2_DOTSN|nr:hypothetical protein DOTSEDRAFT_82193 [Dothistroma septosporum NZE10]
MSVSIPQYTSCIADVIGVVGRGDALARSTAIHHVAQVFSSEVLVTTPIGRPMLSESDGPSQGVVPPQVADGRVELVAHNGIGKPSLVGECFAGLASWTGAQTCDFHLAHTSRDQSTKSHQSRPLVARQDNSSLFVVQRDSTPHPSRHISAALHEVGTGSTPRTASNLAPNHKCHIFRDDERELDRRDSADCCGLRSTADVLRRRGQTRHVRLRPPLRRRDWQRVIKNRRSMWRHEASAVSVRRLHAKPRIRHSKDVDSDRGDNMVIDRPRTPAIPYQAFQDSPRTVPQAPSQSTVIGPKPKRAKVKKCDKPESSRSNFPRPGEPGY